MSRPHDPTPVMLFFAILFAPDAPLAELERRLALDYGPIVHRSADYAFAGSAYYQPEMGPNLTKRIVGIEGTMRPDELIGIKLHTNRLEEYYAVGPEKRRQLNIDPGYLDLARMVLATGKDCAHRIYAGQGIYEEITLLYQRNKGFAPMPWTYPDFTTPETLSFFNELREIFYQQQRKGA